MAMHINDLRPVFKKHTWLLPFVSIGLALTFFITFPIVVILSLWDDIKEGWGQYWEQVIYGWTIPYNKYFGKEDDKTKRRNTDRRDKPTQTG